MLSKKFGKDKFGGEKGEGNECKEERALVVRPSKEATLPARDSFERRCPTLASGRCRVWHLTKI